MVVPVVVGRGRCSTLSAILERLLYWKDVRLTAGIV